MLKRFKILTYFFSACLFTVSFELFLRLAGCGYSIYNQRNNTYTKTVDEKKLIIVTLGESTTADSTDGQAWPRQLEALLNKNGISTQVLNLADPGSNSAYQIAKYDNIYKELPHHLVIGMLGINDLGRNLFFKKQDKDSLKVIQFFKYNWRVFFKPSQPHLDFDLQDTQKLNAFVLKALNLKNEADCDLVAKNLLSSDDINQTVLQNLIYCLPQNNSALNELVKKFNPSLELNQSESGREALIANLQSLKKMTDVNHNCLVLMQYPLTSLDEIYKMIPENSDRTYFIENKINFETELHQKKYEDLFYDRFAGHFGHTNQVGSQMIAENVYKQIKELIQNKKCDLN